MRNFKILYGASILLFVLIAIFFAFYFGDAREAAQEEQKSSTLVVVGDIMLDRYIREVADKRGGDFLFSCDGLDELLTSADLVLANLEGPITSHPSMSVGTRASDGGRHFTFTFPTTTARLLSRHNITLVNLGNNHIMNFSRDGLLETKRWLDAAEVKYFGDPDVGEEARVGRMTLGDVPVSFVNWSDWTSDKTDHTVAQVRKEKEAGRLVIVYTHWGEEYVPPIPRVRTLAHEFINAGAEIVIGSHPHIVQESETYKDKKIYYSLGNFIFDQYFREDVRNGLALRLTITPDQKISIEEIPVRLEKDGRTCLAKP